MGLFVGRSEQVNDNFGLIEKPIGGEKCLTIIIAHARRRADVARLCWCSSYDSIYRNTNLDLTILPYLIERRSRLFCLWATTMARRRQCAVPLRAF
jgi:hypothetical protein